MTSHQDGNTADLIPFQAIPISIILYICIFAIIFTHPTARAAQGSFQQCQNINKKIDYYTALRRKGGPPKTMEKWKQSRKNYKERYREKNCKKWADKL